MGKWIETKNRFINPYNFVPFEKAIRRQIKNDNMTGFIACEMTLLTPLFIPNTSNSNALHDDKENKEGRSYDFFSYQDLSGKDYKDILANPCEPVIPGSEIRGAVRSVFEAAFHGCASQVDSERVFEPKEQNQRKKQPQYSSYNIQKTKLKDILEQVGVNPCQSRTSICSACALFGMVADKDSLGSRVRFGDAQREVKDNRSENSCYFSPTTLPELAEPRPSTVEFYTFPPQGDAPGHYGSWSYSFKSEKNELLKVRGRKIYWHNNTWRDFMAKNDEPDAMRQRIRVLKPTELHSENKFYFQIYFEDITLLELQRLCWALDFNNDNCAHKLGRAKPLGFGSVKISIKKVHVREFVEYDGQWSLDPLDASEWRSQFTSRIIEDLIQIANWKRCLVSCLQVKAPWRKNHPTVCYPKVKADTSNENKSASHQWFKGNCNMKTTQNIKTGFYKILPKISEEVGTDQSRWLYELTEDKTR